MPPAKPLKSKKTIDRSIYFFRVDAGKTSEGVPIAFDLGQHIEKVRDLAFDEVSRRYWPQPNGDAIGIWTDEDGFNDRFALATVRRSALPRGEFQGKLSAIPLARGAGLHEPIHFRVFEDNLVGVEFNFYGPRPSKLPGYLAHALGVWDSPFTMEALLRQDALEQFEQQGGLRLVEMQVRASFAAELAQAEHATLGQVLHNSAEVTGAPVVGVILRPERYGKSFLSDKVVDSVMSAAKHVGMRPNTLKFKTSGLNKRTQKIDPIDLLEDKLVSHKSIIRVGGNSRAIKPSSAYNAIGEAYDELKDQLLLAAGVSAAPTSDD
jgi:hypothetical protein